MTLISVASAFAWPQLGDGAFALIERSLDKVARRQGLVVLSIGLATLLLRLALLPLFPIPSAVVANDFSFMLAADTFVHGRLTNPTPAMWTHFESIHITMQPTYQSMYFPGEGLVLAAGTVLFGHPWFGLLAMDALMCAAICWMLQAWLPPRWALLGGVLAILRLGLFSYWINTYTGGGPILALGGALVLGALPRLKKTARLRYGLLMAVGIVLLVLTRPYEGMLLCLPVAAALGHWAWRGKTRLRPVVLLRRAAVPLLLIVAAIAWLGYYDLRAFGKATTLPYVVNRAQYAMAPYFIWQSQRPQPNYRHIDMRRFYYENELPFFRQIHSWSGFLPATLRKIWEALQFYAGFALLTPLLMMHRAFCDRRIRFLVWSLLVLVAGMSIMIYAIPHYLAPFTCLFYAIGLQAMRHLRLWTPENKPIGKGIVRFSVAICIFMAILRLFTGPLNIRVPEWPLGNWSIRWYGPDPYTSEHTRIEASLEHLPGKQLVLVRPNLQRNVLDQWVYNGADIDDAKVVWAQEMDTADNLELIHYYRDRQAWLVDPNTVPARISPYPMPEPTTGAAH
ncbi:MAG: hypothetical protein WCF30_04435 [Terracidiphilus sp.]